MTRIVLVLALTAFAAPAFAANAEVTTVTVRHESSYVKGVQKQVRKRQAQRRAKLQNLERAAQARVSHVQSPEALFQRAILSPVSNEAEIAARK